MPWSQGGFDTEAEELTELGRTKAKIARGATAADVNAGLWFEEWLAAKTDIRPATQRSCAGHIHNYLIPHLGIIALTSCAPNTSPRRLPKLRAVTPPGSGCGRCCGQRCPTPCVRAWSR